MDLVALLNNLVANINELQAKLIDAQVSADALAKQKYDEGFAAGVASVPTPQPSDKLYSQEEMDAAIQSAVVPLNEKIAEFKHKSTECRHRSMRKFQKQCLLSKLSFWLNTKLNKLLSQILKLASKIF